MIRSRHVFSTHFSFLYSQIIRQSALFLISVRCLLSKPGWRKGAWTLTRATLHWFYLFLARSSLISILMGFLYEIDNIFFRSHSLMIVCWSHLHKIVFVTEFIQKIYKTFFGSITTSMNILTDNLFIFCASVLVALTKMVMPKSNIKLNNKSDGRWIMMAISHFFFFVNDANQKWKFQKRIDVVTMRIRGNLFWVETYCN